MVQARGATLLGYTDASAEAGYEHSESKTEREGKFVGLVCDAVNQDDLTDGRVAAWCAQLEREGFFAAGAAGASASAATLGAPAGPSTTTSATEPAGAAAGSAAIFFGSISGAAEDVADRLKLALGEGVAGPFDVADDDAFAAEALLEYDSLLVGLPTYNTGADTMRSGTVWDELYYAYRHQEQ